MRTGNLHLAPGLYEASAREHFFRSGQSVGIACSPTDNSMVTFATLSPGTIPGPSRPAGDYEEPLLHVVGLDKAPSSERRLFITDTSVIFVALRKLLEDTTKPPSSGADAERQQKMIKLAEDYVNHIKECWVHASQPIVRPDGPLQYSADHYRSLYTCFSLFVLLYMPAPGFENAPVGDEFMEWLNVHFIEPSSEEGDQLSALDRPWEDENFWPYLTRTTLRGLTKASVFFLDILSRHPSQHVQHLSSRLAPLLDSHPRLQNFPSERDHAAAARKWKDQVKILRLELDRVPEAARDDTFENWWNWMSDIVGVLEGRADVLKRVCFDLGSDWKEVCAAWTIFVNVRLRRADLPQIVSQLVDEMPPDPTNMEDMVHVALCSGSPMDALTHAAAIDIWLAAHLSDIMEAVGLLDGAVDNPRQGYVLGFSEYLQSDPGLWRITVEYMCSCGDIGEERADEVLMRVPLRLDQPERSEGDVLAGDVVGVLQEINQACFAHGREGVRRMVCRIAARTFIEKREYGLAVSYCTSAEDWPGLGRAVDCVLDQFVTHGALIFVKLVAEIAPSLQQLRSHAGPNGVFVHRLMFAARYAEFHQRMLDQDYQEAALNLVALFREGVAPKAWWGVLLADAIVLLQDGTMLLSSTDACELLFRLQEVETAASHGAGSDYLCVLVSIFKLSGEKEALSRLRPVRLALARYIARCAVIGVGGKDSHGITVRAATIAV